MTGRGNEYLRKSIHVALGGFALCLRWVQPWQAAVAAAGALVFNLLLVHRLTGRRLLREPESSGEFSWGVAIYPAAVLGSILVFHRRLELAAAVWGLLAFGDGMAAIAGTLVGGPAIAWNRAKRWSGSLAFVVWGTLAAAILLRWTQLGALGGNGSVHIGSSFLATGGMTSNEQDRLFLLAGCLAAAVAAAFFETLDTRLDDNFTVPLVGGAVLWAATWVQPAKVIALASAPPTSISLAVSVNAVAALAAFLSRRADLSGAVVGSILGSLLFVFAGWSGWLLLLLFVALGSWATHVGESGKRARGIAETSRGGRTAGQALANAGAGVCFAFLSITTSDPALFRLAMVAAFCTATCDTLGTEIGKVFGRYPITLLPIRRVAPGEPGGVTLVGSAAGIAGASLVAGAAWATGLVGSWGVLAAVAGAAVGSSVESVVAGLWRTTHASDHHLKNLANTVGGAIVAMALGLAVS